MKKLFILMLMIGVIVSCQKEDATNFEPIDQSSVKAGNFSLGGPLYFCLNEEFTIDPPLPLVAGQDADNPVGEVLISADANNLYIEYVLFDYDITRLTETHIYAGSYEERPKTKKGNPKIGNFPYGDMGEGLALEYTIPKAEITHDEGSFIVAVHGVVEFLCDGVEPVEFNLPEDCKWLSVSTSDPGPKLAYFWHATLGTDDCDNFVENDMWDGEYEGWCLDPLINISTEWCYKVCEFYSSYAVPDGIFLNEENFPKVNWLLNQNFVGQVYVPGGEENNKYTFGDIQILIWQNINNTASYGPSDLGAIGGVGGWNADRIGYLQGLMDEHTNFVPSCLNEDKIGIVLMPSPIPGTSVPIQPVLILKPLECYWCDDETAWMTGNQWWVNEGGSWASYQEFICD